jgi:hypothetical protein
VIFVKSIRSSKSGRRLPEGCSEPLSQSESGLAGLSLVAIPLKELDLPEQTRLHACRPHIGNMLRLGHLSPIPQRPFCAMGRQRPALDSGASGAGSAPTAFKALVIRGARKLRNEPTLGSATILDNGPSDAGSTTPAVKARVTRSTRKLRNEPTPEDFFRSCEATIVMPTEVRSTREGIET